VWEIRENGPYLYLRRWIVGPDGRRRLKNVGYYGKAGIEALNMGLGEQLLKAHNEGGEQAAESLISSHVDEELPERWWGKKYPADAPIHPFNDERITLKSLNDNPLYQYIERHHPADAREMLRKLQDYEDDQAAYNHAVRFGYVWRTPMREINRRRNNLRFRIEGQPRRLIRARVKQKPDNKPGSKRQKKR
jgi:hypothetical protein